MYRLKFIAILGVLLIFSLGVMAMSLYVGYEMAKANPHQGSHDTEQINWAIEFLESCRDTHQYYLEHTDIQNSWTGDTNRHRHLINDYNKTIEILRGWDEK